MIERYKEVVRKYIRAAIAQMKQQWSSYPSDMGNADAVLIEQQRAADTIAFILAAKGQKMWILEYGKGEFMDKQNPFLAEYLADPNFYRLRKSRGLKVLGRPKGPYLDLDGNVHYSNGHLQGVPLEEVGLYKFIDNEIGHPKKPRYIIRNILFGSGNNGILAEMEKELQQVTLKMVEEAFNKFPKRIVIM